jgi:hypothetical protein
MMMQRSSSSVQQFSLSGLLAPFLTVISHMQSMVLLGRSLLPNLNSILGCVDTNAFTLIDSSS